MSAAPGRPASASAHGGPETAAPRRIVARRRGGVFALATAPLLAAAAIVVAVTLAGGSFVYRELDRQVPGEVTSVTDAALTLLATVSGIVCVGALCYVVFLRAPAGRNRLRIAVTGEVRLVWISALVWSASAAALVGVDGVDSNGLPISRLLRPGTLSYVVQASYSPGAWLVVTACAFVIFCAVFFVERWAAGVALIGVGLVGALAPVMVGQVLVGANHDFGGDATLFALPAEVLWFGAGAVLAAHAIRGDRLKRVTLRRFGMLSAGCWLTIAAGDVILELFETVGGSPLASPTGLLFLVEFAALAVLLGLGAVGRRLWRRGVRLDSTAFLSVFVGGVVTAGAYIGAEVARTRVPPPVFLIYSSAQDLYFGYQVDSPPSVQTMIDDWRINILFFVPTVLAALLYLVAVRRLHRAGRIWPRRRTVLWLSGCAALILTTSSALGPYASASFSIHMIFHMSLNMLAPLLLVLGGPMTLALEALPVRDRTQPAGPREWLLALQRWPAIRMMHNPMAVFVAFVGSYFAIYFTPFFGWAMRYHWSHQWMNLHIFLVGYLFYGMVIGVDRLARPLPHLGKLGMVFAAMPFHAFFGVLVMTTGTIIGNQFYGDVDVSWMHNLRADQTLGGIIAWGAGEAPLLVIVLLLAAQWARQDRHRAAESGTGLRMASDDGSAAYAAMLTSFARRSAGKEPEAVETAAAGSGTAEADAPRAGAVPADRAEQAAREP